MASMYRISVAFCFLMVTAQYLNASYFNEYIIKFKDNVTIHRINEIKQAVDPKRPRVLKDDKLLKRLMTRNPKKIRQALRKSIGNGLRRYSLKNSFVLSLEHAVHVDDIYHDFLDCDEIEYIEPNYQYQFQQVDDPSFFKQYYLKNIGQKIPDNEPTGLLGVAGVDINVETAWQTTTGNKDVLIGVLDTGVDWYHPDLIHSIWVNSGEDLNGDGIVNGERFFDVGVDGIRNDSEFGYVDIHSDPNNDNYNRIGNPTGTEGNGKYDIGEPFLDYGMDRLDGTGDNGEGNSVFDPGEFNGLDDDG